MRSMRRDPEDGSVIALSWKNRRSEGLVVDAAAIEALRSYFPITKGSPLASLRTELSALQSACRFRASFLITPDGREPFFVHGDLTALVEDPERENRTYRLRLEYNELADELVRFLASASRRKTDGLSVWIPLGLIEHGSVIVYNRREPDLPSTTGRMVADSRADRDEPDPSPILFLYVIERGVVQFAYDV